MKNTTSGRYFDKGIHEYIYLQRELQVMHLHPFEKSFVDQDFLQAINQPHEAMHAK